MASIANHVPFVYWRTSILYIHIIYFTIEIWRKKNIALVSSHGSETDGSLDGTSPQIPPLAFLRHLSMFFFFCCVLFPSFSVGECIVVYWVGIRLREYTNVFFWHWNRSIWPNGLWHITNNACVSNKLSFTFEFWLMLRQME